MTSRRLLTWIQASILLCLPMAPTASAQVNPQRVVAVGGEAMSFSMGLWGDTFAARQPGFSLEMRIDGEDRAFKDMAEGKSDLAMMARDATTEELDGFKAKWGYPPTRVAVAMDAFVWVVNKQNPIRAMRIEAVNSIYTANRLMGWPIDVITWGDAGVKDRDWKNRTITRYFRPTNSSVMGLLAMYFPPSETIGEGKVAGLADNEDKWHGKRSVLRMPMTLVPDAMAMAETLAADPCGIGMANMAEVFASMKPVAMIIGENGPEVLPTAEAVSSGAYPYSRFLYVYLNKDPKRGLRPVVRDFLAYALSEEGQGFVKAAGQAPLAVDIAALNRLKVTDRFDADPKRLR